MRAIDAAFAVRHFHQSRIRPLPGVTMGGLLLGDRYNMAVQEFTGNVWLAEGDE